MIHYITKPYKKKLINVARVSINERTGNICVSRIVNGKAKSLRTKFSIRQFKYFENQIKEMSFKKLARIENWKAILSKLERVSENGMLLERGMMVKLWYWSVDHTKNKTYKYDEYHTIYRVGKFGNPKNGERRFELIPVLGGQSIFLTAGLVVTINTIIVLDNAVEEYKDCTEERLRTRDNLLLYKALAGNIYEMFSIDVERKKVKIAVPPKVCQYESTSIGKKYLNGMMLAGKRQFR